jgi:magnesium-transporting ATPase (P-type)
LYTELKVNEKGLSDDEHTARLAIYGLNEISPPKVRHWFLKFLDTLSGGF